MICGWAVLHHLLPVLDAVLADLQSVARPDTKWVFAEPISVWGWLRKLRLMLPIKVHGTPDERPLNVDDLALFRAEFQKWKCATLV